MTYDERFDVRLHTPSEIGAVLGQKTCTAGLEHPNTEYEALYRRLGSELYGGEWQPAFPADRLIVFKALPEYFLGQAMKTAGLVGAATAEWKFARNRAAEAKPELSGRELDQEATFVVSQNEVSWVYNYYAAQLD